MEIQTTEGPKEMKNKLYSRILGLNLHQDYSWRAHLEQGALRYLGSTIPRRGRLMLTNGLIISKLIYMISVWGGTPNTYTRKFQKIMNDAARFIQNDGRRWSTFRLMESVNWLTAK